MKRVIEAIKQMAGVFRVANRWIGTSLFPVFVENLHRKSYPTEITYVSQNKFEVRITLRKGYEIVYHTCDCSGIATDALTERLKVVANLREPFMFKPTNGYITYIEYGLYAEFYIKKCFAVDDRLSYCPLGDRDYIQAA
jgi:hypothetical protein